LKRYADDCTYFTDREDLFQETRDQRKVLHDMLDQVFESLSKRAKVELGETLGLDLNLKGFEVHEMRRSIRVSPDGKHLPQIVIALMQTSDLAVGSSTHTFRGGSTLMVDLANSVVKYAIRKRINSQTRKDRTEEFLKDALADPLKSLLLGTGDREPFAALHALADLAN